MLVDVGWTKLSIFDVRLQTVLRYHASLVIQFTIKIKCAEDHAHRPSGWSVR